MSKRTAIQHVIPRASLLVAVAFLLPLPLTACSNTTTPPEQSGQSGAADVQMSGEYEIGPDGKLKQPNPRKWHMPAMNEAANQHNETGAEIFSIDFVRFVEYAWNTGDTQAMKQWCHPDSKGCQSMADEINAVYSKGGWIDGGQYQFRQVITQMPYPQSGVEGAQAIALWITSIDKKSYNGKQLFTDEIVHQTQWELHLLPKEDSWIVRGFSIRTLEEQK